jgi:sodium/bile acid cotransporter 7
MVLMFAAPCTLASAAVWTARAGGDDSVAIMVTIITSCFCFLTTPAIIYCFIGQTISPTILTSTVWKLLICIVLPIGIAQILRLQKASAAWATENKRSVNKVAQCGILSVVFIGSIASALKIGDTSTSGYGAMIVVSVVLMLVVHALVLVAGVAIAKSLGMNRSEQIAVAFSGSQKTLMVALSVAASLGVTIIPLVAYHSLQLFIDTLIADFWFKGDR